VEAARVPFSGDDGTQVLLALVLLAHGADARQGAVIGHGTGMSSHFLLGSPNLEELVTIEIEPAMVRGARAFYPANRRAFDDPRSTLVFDDARAWFAATKRRFGFVLSEPSNPWVSGVSGLFTVEFYAQVKRYLAPGAVFGQWLQSYEMNDGLVISVLAGIHEQFADYRVYLINSSDLLVVATPEGKLRDPDWSVFSHPAIAQDLCGFGSVPAAALEPLAVADRASLDPLFESGIRPNSDFYPVLDLGAERARFLRGTASGVTGLAAGVLPYLEAPELDVGPGGLAVGTALDRVLGVRVLQLATLLRQDLREKPDSEWTIGFGNTERYLMRVWAAQSSSGRGPPMWRGWTSDFWSVFRVLHGGRLGPDSAFFAMAHGHARRFQAPEPVLGTIAFAEALAGRDMEAAATSARVLLAEARAGRHWLPADDLLDGAVLSLAAAGRAEEAREAYATLVGSSTRLPMDLRLILLNAYIERARAGVGGTVHD
jgi:hypothetical protein